jgi:Flp pilus assembly protein TadD
MSIAELPAAPTGAQVTEVARRRSRFRYAMDRVARIADGEPRFTDEELAELAAVILARLRREDTAA